MLFAWARSAHRVRLSSAGLAIRQERDVVSLREGIDRFIEIVPNALLRDIGAKDAIENEEFAPLRGIDGKASIGGGLDHRSLESLRDKVIARVGGIQRRSDSNGCSVVSIARERID